MLKKLIAPVVIAGALLGGVATAGIASAATPATATAAAPATKAAHPLRAWLHKHRRQIRRAGLAVSAKTIGVTPQALATELRSGKSIAQVASEHNVPSQSVVDALVSAADARVTQAVSDHKLTSAQASKITAALPAYVMKAVSHVF